MIGKNYIAVFILFFLLSCTTKSTISDYSTLKQKALEIPPDFELTPPEEGKVEESKQLDVDNNYSDIEELLSQETDSVSPNTSSNESLEDFFENNFDVQESTIESSSGASAAKDLKESDNQISTSKEIDETVIEKTEQNLGLSDEEFLEGISDTDEITALSEEEQLKPEIIDDEIYDDSPSFDENEDLNDLLNRVDDLLNSYSN